MDLERLSHIKMLMTDGTRMYICRSMNGEGFCKGHVGEYSYGSGMGNGRFGDFLCFFFNVFVQSYLGQSFAICNHGYMKKINSTKLLSRIPRKEPVMVGSQFRGQQDNIIL